MALTPADRGWEIQVLVDRIAALEQQLGALMRTPRVTGQRAEVTAFTSGSSMCTVRFLATSNTAPMPYLLGYTPIPGHGGHVVDLGSGLIFIPASSF